MHDKLLQKATSYLLCCSLGLVAAHALAVVVPQPKPYLRLDSAPTFLKLDPSSHFIAYAGKEGMGLSLTELKSKKIFQISAQRIGPSFFFSPDGFRLFYRELLQDPKSGVRTRVQVYDIAQHKTVTLDELASSSSYMTFDPRDFRLKLLHKGGIVTRQILFPDERLARWQAAQKRVDGKWLATQQGILWLTMSGYTMRKLQDDGSGVDSFDISPRGTAIVWATHGGNIYVSEEGSPARKIGEGLDPRWHPSKPLVVCAGSRKVGPKVINYDLKLIDTKGKGRFITNTQSSWERWPVFTANGESIIYTMSGSTDLYRMDLKI